MPEKLPVTWINLKFCINSKILSADTLAESFCIMYQTRGRTSLLLFQTNINKFYDFNFKF